MKLLNKNNLAVRFAASKEKSRYSIQAILATENETVATDGHMMVRVSLPRDAKENNFPVIEGFKPNGFTRGMIPVEAAKAIEAAIPNSKLPALNFAAITTEHVDNKDVLKVAATDLETPKVFTVTQPDGSFPSWENVWPDADQKPAADICVDARLLAAIAQGAAKFSDNKLCAIRLRIYSPNAAMRFDVVNDGQEMNGLLMPCRADVKPTFKDVAKPAPIAASEPDEETEPDDDDESNRMDEETETEETETEPAAQAACGLGESK